MSIQVPFGNQHADERFTGHGSEWKDSSLNPDDAKTATQWVEAKIDKRSMLTTRKHVEDVRDIMWQLEKDGEIVVHRVNDGHEPVMTKTLYGWDKKIPTNRLWHHKSCGQCGNIPGYPTSLLWLMNEQGTTYLDETDQTSCTAWNYHGSGIGNVVSLAAVFLRNFHQAYVAISGGRIGSCILLSSGALWDVLWKLQRNAAVSPKVCRASRTG